MTSLIVLCPHCLTWIEPHAESCTECGVAVNLNDHDPNVEIIAERLGDQMQDLGAMKLLRRGWPACGRLLLTTRGLLFVPEFAVRSNGALEAVTDDASAGSQRVASLFHWWSIPPWRRPLDEPDPKLLSANRQPQSTLDLLFDAPGSFFVTRTSIQRIHFRWGRVQIERPPYRSVSLTQVQGGSQPRDALRHLQEYPEWRGLVAGL